MASGVYDTGTITLTNGSATVTGSGTSWVGNISAGNVLITDGGAVYPIEEVVSATEITLSRPFTGSGGSGASYEIVPTGGVAQALTARINTLISSFQSVVDEAGQGKFPDGSLAQPGVRFTADEDTGVRRTGANAVALVAGGVDAFGVTSGGAATGAAVQSNAYDDTADRLMQVGAFGLGGQAPSILEISVTDMDDLVTPGFWTLSGTIDNTPFGTSAIAGTCMVVERKFTTGPRITQFANYQPSGKEKFWYRQGSGNPVVWGDWREIYHSGSILGTVSQSGGTPTGAVIERGLNSNGEYVRFADGTQICYALPPQITANPTTWTFPATFSAVPVVLATTNQTAARILAVQAGSVSASLYCFNPSGSAASGYAFALAIGRWF